MNDSLNKLIYLREATLEDGEKIVGWRSNPAVMHHCLDNTRITKESHEIFYNKNVLTGNYLQYMVEVMDTEFSQVSYPIATVYLKDFDRINEHCEMGLYPSSDEEWDDNRKSYAVKLLLKKAFEDLGYHKVYTYVFLDCEDELKLYENAGFKKEGTLREEIKISDGSYRDMLRLGCLKTEYYEKIQARCLSDE